MTEAAPYAATAAWWKTVRAAVWKGVWEAELRAESPRGQGSSGWAAD